MANKAPLASWLYLNKKELNPQFTEFTWPGRILPGYFDFLTTIEYEGLTASGRGIDTDREIALEKSVAESFERIICRRFGHSSVGLAIAASFDPVHIAKYESLERYFLDKHLALNEPFIPLDISYNFIQNFKSYNPKAKIEFYQTNTSENLVGTVCSLTPSNINTRALGFSLTDSLESSVRKSMLEALPNYALLIEDTKALDKPNLPWHLSSNFLSQIEPLLTYSNAKFKNVKLPVLKKLNIKVDELPFLKNKSIHIAHFVVDKPEENL